VLHREHHAVVIGDGDFVTLALAMININHRLLEQKFCLGHLDKRALQKGGKQAHAAIVSEYSTR
jgi:hypothetical protein